MLCYISITDTIWNVFLVIRKEGTNMIVSYELENGVKVPVSVIVNNGEISEDEAFLYVKRGYEKYESKVIDEVKVELDGDFVDLEYHFSSVPFERIRRITGYLVGTLDRFNNAKRSEVTDRVKHSV